MPGLALLERQVDWNEDSVAREFADSLGLDFEDVYVTDDSEFGVNLWRVEIGSREYLVFEDEDDAKDYAIGYLTAQYENDPASLAGVAEWVIKDNVFVSPTDIRLISRESGDSYAYEIDDKDAVREAGMEDEYYDALDDDGDVEQVVTDARDKVSDNTTQNWEDGLKQDPIGFLSDEEDIYSVEQLLSKVSFIQINFEGVAKDIVVNDGTASVLATYDDAEQETDQGLIYYRTD